LGEGSSQRNGLIFQFTKKKEEGNNSGIGKKGPSKGRGSVNGGGEERIKEKEKNLDSQHPGK